MEREQGMLNEQFQFYNDSSFQLQSPQLAPMDDDSFNEVKINIYQSFQETKKNQTAQKNIIDHLENIPFLKQQKKISIGLYQIFQLYHYLEDVLLTKSHDPILSLVSSSYSDQPSISLHQQENNQMRDEIDPPPFSKKSDFKEESSSDYFQRMMTNLKCETSSLRNLFDIYEKVKIEQKTFKQGLEKENIKRNVIEKVWKIIHNEIEFLDANEFQLFIQLRNKIDVVQEKLNTLGQVNGNLQKLEQLNGKKSICKLCWDVFDNGKMLGGHVAKKHPGFSKEYKIRQFLQKTKKNEKKRRQFFERFKGKKPKEEDEENEIYEGEEDEFIPKVEY